MFTLNESNNFSVYWAVINTHYKFIKQNITEGKNAYDHLDWVMSSWEGLKCGVLQKNCMLFCLQAIQIWLL